jgi:hypothetical protein
MPNCKLKIDPHPSGMDSVFHPDGMKEKADSIRQAGQGLPQYHLPELPCVNTLRCPSVPVKQEIRFNGIKIEQGRRRFAQIKRREGWRQPPLPISALSHFG